MKKVKKSSFPSNTGLRYGVSFLTLYISGLCPDKRPAQSPNKLQAEPRSWTMSRQCTGWYIECDQTLSDIVWTLYTSWPRLLVWYIKCDCTLSGHCKDYLPHLMYRAYVHWSHFLTRHRHKMAMLWGFATTMKDI